MVNNHMMLLLRDIAIIFPAFLLVFTFRGFTRALVSFWMGDDTARENGFLTLNPLVHVDIVGLSIMLFVLILLGGMFGGQFPRPMLFVMLIFIGIRWTYSTPYNPSQFRRFKLGYILTILSGSLGCFLLSYLFLWIQKYLPYGLLSMGVATSLMSINGTIILLASYFGVLALVPLPPFEGGRLLRFILPASRQGIVDWLEEYSMFIFLALFLLPVVSDLFFGVINMCSFLVIRLLSFFVL